MTPTNVLPRTFANLYQVDHYYSECKDLVKLLRRLVTAVKAVYASNGMVVGVLLSGGDDDGWEATLFCKGCMDVKIGGKDNDSL